MYCASEVPTLIIPGPFLRFVISVSVVVTLFETVASSLSKTSSLASIPSRVSASKPEPAPSTLEIEFKIEVAACLGSITFLSLFLQLFSLTINVARDITGYPLLLTFNFFFTQKTSSANKFALKNIVTSNIRTLLRITTLIIFQMLLSSIN